MLPTINSGIYQGTIIHKTIVYLYWIQLLDAYLYLVFMNDSYYMDSKVTLHSTAKKGLSRLHKNFEHNFNIIYYGSL